MDQFLIDSGGWNISSSPFLSSSLFDLMHLEGIRRSSGWAWGVGVVLLYMGMAAHVGLR